MKKSRKLAIFILACLAFVVAIIAAFFLFPEQTIPHVILSETPQFEGVPKNSYDKSLFREENGFLRYDGENCLVGIDVSSHQGQIDWQAVKDAGVDFAIIRGAYRGYTNGGLSADEMFLLNLEGAKRVGIQVGAYLFSQAISEQEALEEAEFLLEYLKDIPLDLPVYFDWEYVEAESRTQNIGGADITSFALRFCEKIEDAGYKAGVYFNKSMGYTVMNLSRLRDYEFWLAEYAAVPEFYFRYETWQYTDKATIDGIDAMVDLNIRFLTSEERTEG